MDLSVQVGAKWFEWVTSWPFASLGAGRLKYFTCSGSYVGHAGGGNTQRHREVDGFHGGHMSPRSECQRERYQLAKSAMK
jgi:hypothetical protein